MNARRSQRERTAVFVLSGVLAGAVACRQTDVKRDPPIARSAPPSPTEAPSASAPRPGTKPPRVRTDWCIDAVDTLDEETCAVVPEQSTKALLIYFHGIVPPTPESAQKTNYQTIVANFARRASVAALMPKGQQGFAPAGNPGWWGWPTTEAAYQEHAKALVDSVSSKKRNFEDVLGFTFSQTFVAGSSSGAYFVAELALHGGIAADGFAAISGGGGRKTPELAKLPPKPFYIGYGTYDTVGKSARALGDVLRGAGWPVKVEEHPLGHGARDVYLDEAFEFYGYDMRKK